MGLRGGGLANNSRVVRLEGGGRVGRMERASHGWKARIMALSVKRNLSLRD